MSSIFGKYNSYKNPVDATELTLMKNALNYWQADASDILLQNSVGLGHLMLYNTPESLSEKLPYSDSASGCIITANARIDNRDELLAKLSVSPCGGKEIADSVLILKTYLRYGRECLEHLVGDFSFAIWDPREQTLFCARDHVGVKPFFYYSDDNFFAFASEKKGLLALPALNKEINDDYLVKIVAYIDPAPDETPYKNIFRLPPAHYILATPNGVSVHQYWRLDVKRSLYYKNPQDYIHGFREVFGKAVQSRLRTAYTVGAELSGGLDSSGIVSVASPLLKQQGKSLTTFSYVFDEETSAIIPDAEKKSEEHYADDVIREAGIEKAVKISKNNYKDIFELTDLSLFINDGPYSLTLWNNTSKRAAGAHGVKVLLSGFPGDELVTNYAHGSFMESYSRKKYLRFIKEAGKSEGLLNALSLFVKVPIDKHWPHFFTPVRNRRQAVSHWNNPRNFLVRNYPADKYERLFQAPLGWADNFREIQRRSIEKMYVSERLEAEDRNTLLYRAETRFPMADRRLLQFVISLPLDQKITDTENRVIYRRAMKGVMPRSIVERNDKSSTMQPFTLLDWERAREKKLEWLQQQDIESLLPFLDKAAFLEAYTLNFFENHSLMHGVNNRKRIEGLIRWLAQR